MLRLEQNLTSVTLMLLLAASIVLWRKRRRGGALLQLIGWTLFVIAEIVHRFTNFAMESQRRALYDFMISPPVSLSATTAIYVGVLLIAGGYIWYAVAEERI